MSSSFKRPGQTDGPPLSHPLGVSSIQILRNTFSFWLEKMSSLDPYSVENVGQWSLRLLFRIKVDLRLIPKSPSLTRLSTSRLEIRWYYPLSKMFSVLCVYYWGRHRNTDNIGFSKIWYNTQNTQIYRSLLSFESNPKKKGEFHPRKNNVNLFMFLKGKERND